MFVVVAYDITDDRRRRAVARLLAGAGERVQWSVFECELAPGQLASLQQMVAQVVEASEDQIRWYFLCQECKRAIASEGQGPGTCQRF
jgi:CRISPR-associated protein Cas2